MGRRKRAREWGGRAGSGRRSREGGEIRVRFTREPAGVLPAVWDSPDGRPVHKRPLGAVLGDAAPDTEALSPGRDDGTDGRGLPLVDALADEYGVTETEPGGKWAWDRFSIAAEQRPGR